MSFISVITPTWQRHSNLLERCIPSVQAQLDVEFEHLVISDGPDSELRELVQSHIRYFELPEHDPVKHWGAPARNFGLTQAKGEFIAYLDDDDWWEPDHLLSLVSALNDEPEADFARSCAMIPHGINGIPWRIGDGPIAHGRVQSSMLMHRKYLEANWVTNAAEDWHLVKGWADSGILCAVTGKATVTHNPSGGTKCAFVVLLEE
jgi:glycosyltransferase involved in cell wall biosynthesis